MMVEILDLKADLAGRKFGDEDTYIFILWAKIKWREDDLAMNTGKMAGSRLTTAEDYDFRRQTIELRAE